MKWQNEEYIVSNEKDWLDIEVIYKYLSTAYWSKGIDKTTIEISIENSICFGLYKDKSQLGFLRVITDKATFAYFADVFVIEGYRGRGLGVWMLECALTEISKMNLRRTLLATRDAHDLYRKFNFSNLSKPDIFMEIERKNCYLNPQLN